MNDSNMRKVESEDFSKYAFCYECGIVFQIQEIHYLTHGEVDSDSTLNNREGKTLFKKGR